MKIMRGIWKRLSPASSMSSLMELAAITTGAIMLTRRVFGKPPVDYYAAYRAASCTGRRRRHLIRKEQSERYGESDFWAPAPWGAAHSWVVGTSRGGVVHVT